MGLVPSVGDPEVDPGLTALGNVSDLTRPGMVWPRIPPVQLEDEFWEGKTWASPAQTFAFTIKPR